MKSKKIIITMSSLLLSVLIIFTFISSPTLSSLLPFNIHTNHRTQSSPEEYSKLSHVCEEMTKYILSADGISCNFSIKNSEAYLGNNRPDSLGTFDTYAFTKENAFLENMLSKLSDIKTSSLSDKDNLTYNALYESLVLSLSLGKYPLLFEPLSPISGIHTQLPLLLGEYHFYDAGYIETYFNILRSIPAYFSQIIEFEKYKADNNRFMSEELANKVISQCRDFIARPIQNHLITVFDEKIKAFEQSQPPQPGGQDAHISKEQLNDYSITNKNIVLNEIIPAYESLISAIESLKKYSTPATGLCNITLSTGNTADTNNTDTTDNINNTDTTDTQNDDTLTGKTYYTKLFRQQTCSGLAPGKAYDLFKKTLDSCKKNIATLIASDKQAGTPQSGSQTDSQNTSQSGSETDPSSTAETAYNMVATLKQSMASSYPELALNSELKIKPVPASLESSLSPAMYLTPPIDDFENDCVYINNASCDPESLYTTLAHEAFPGHMYQIRYFHSLNPEPVRLLLNMPGYAEGWATYSELDMTDSMGYDTQTAELLKNNKLAVLCIYSIIDLGVHYYGWELFDCIEFLSENGFDDVNSAKEIYTDIVYEPVIYPKYALGCIEFMNMKKYAEKKKGDEFNPIEFHKLILETGPIWFDDLWKIVKEKY